MTGNRMRGIGKILKSVLLFAMVLALTLGVPGIDGFGAIKVYAAESGSNGNFGSLADFSFTATDVRTGAVKQFNGSAGKTTVFIFGYYDSDPTAGQFAKIVSHLDQTKIDVFVIDEDNTYEENRAFAEKADPKGVLTVSGDAQLSCGQDAIFGKCYGGTVGWGNSYYIPLVVYVNGSGTIYAFTTGSSVSDDQILDNLVAGGVQDTYRGRTVFPDVERHTAAEIRQFAALHPVQDLGAEYVVTPSTTAPYVLGQVRPEVLQDALNAVNQIRYIAGLSSDVTLDDEYITLTQASSVVNGANGTLSHYPVQPAGMDDDLYQLGSTGSGRSNIAAGYRSIADSIIGGYMDDGDASNIARVGHRRWILNPAMGKTGFGIAPSSSGYGWFSALYAFDRSGRSNASVSMWPALNTPVQYFGSDYPWSYSTGVSEDISTVKVELKNVRTDQTWNFYQGTSDGYFNVENGGYGLSGCIIFRPSSVSYSAGDVYSVKITGLAGDLTVAYYVEFFDLANARSEDTLADQYNSGILNNNQGQNNQNTNTGNENGNTNQNTNTGNENGNTNQNTNAGNENGNTNQNTNEQDDTSKLDCAWYVSGGKSYWYEGGVRQGTFSDPKGVIGDGTVRGREIYDHASNAWYWLDSIYDGAKAIGKEVWMPYIYQNEAEWNEAKMWEIAQESDPGMENLVFECMKGKTGKWVRYDTQGRMLKGWVTISGDLETIYPDQAGNIYYYDNRTGLMARGYITLDGVTYHFDEITGALIR